MYWFLIHCPKITAATTSPIVFATLALDPLGRLQSAGVAGALDLLFRQINGFHFPFGVGPLLVLGALFFYPWMVALFSLAFLGGLSLIGPWAAQHAYYFFGSSIVSTAGWS